MKLDIEVVVWRGPIPESRHRIQAVCVDASGRIRAATSEPRLLTAFRSSAKPFQMLPLVERGHADQFGFDEPTLAVMAASHTGSRRHVALARGILTRIGLDESHLACGYHEPQDSESLADVRNDPSLCSPIYNNCSGKHAGMLAMCLAEGWPTAGYEQAAHPLQRLLHETVASVCDCAPGAVAVAVDGCSACVFGLPLQAMATGYARFAAAPDSGTARERALARIRAAMAAHPFVVGGHDRFDTQFGECTHGRRIAKVGAEGLECVAIPEHGLGLVAKCEDGNGRATGPATLALLQHLDLLTHEEIEALAPLRRPVITNVRGLSAGVIEAEVRVPDPIV
jgi:L-asparaginase II